MIRKSGIRLSEKHALGPDPRDRVQIGTISQPDFDWIEVVGFHGASGSARRFFAFFEIAAEGRIGQKNLAFAGPITHNGPCDDFRCYESGDSWRR
jgi:hypothetical protein